MDKKRTLTYTKSSGFRKIVVQKELAREDSADNDRVATIPAVVPPRSYRKEEGVLSYGLYCVISGGTVREKTFLSEVECKHSFRNLEVIFVSSKANEGGLTPKMMLEKYHEITSDGILQLSGRNVHLDMVDKIYMFTDVDHYKSELIEILKKNTSKGSPIWIISNPDFEIWLYYCFKNSPEQDLIDVLNEQPSQRSTKLKSVNGTFNNGGGLDTRKAFEHLEDGIAHSKEHFKIDVNGIPCLFCTQMHVFAEDVLLKLGKEYTEWKKKKESYRNFKKEHGKSKQELTAHK